MAKGLGRRVPPDFAHVAKYPLRALAPTAPATVERRLRIPFRRRRHDQGEEGACVGFAATAMMSILNSGSELHYYDPWWLWDRAKERDAWPDTNPGDSNGTSVRAACDVLRAVGHCRVRRGRKLDPSPEQGISANRWATSVDDIRWCIANGIPVTTGFNWYAAADDPERVKGEWWILHVADWGRIRGGHSTLVYGASDRREACALLNSWGTEYPLVWVPYSAVERLLREDGEATMVTDR